MRPFGVNKPVTNDPRGKSSAAVARGDMVLFRWERGEALARIEEKATRIEGLGVLKESTVVGIPFGGRITIGAQTVHLIRPTLPDYLRLLKRGAQIITPKDAGLILLNCAIGAGASVVEFGVGSGALTLTLLHAVGPHGKVISIDNNPKHCEVARKNVARTPWGASWELREEDCRASKVEHPADAVVMDLPSPWECIASAREALVPCGRLASYSPTINQTEKLATGLEAAGFGDVRTVELLEREHIVREGSSRPSFEMLGHTGYLTFARKLE